MNYRQYAVHPALKNWIRYFWSYDVYTKDIQVLHIRSFADRFPRLVFQDPRSLSAIKEVNGNVKPVCYLSGIDTIPTESTWISRFSHFGVSFHPHGLNAIFGIDAAELRDKTPDIALLVKEDITNLLLDAKSHEERVVILQRYFYEKTSARKYDSIISDLFSEKWAGKLEHETSLASIANQYKISERQLQRRFKHSVGISASKFSRITKFEKTLQALSAAGYGKLTKVGYDMGYADQSHFIHDFKLFSGLTPYDFIKSNTVGSESASFIYLE